MYCLNNPTNNIDPTGRWTIGFSIGANFNLFFGVSISIGIYFDDNGNVDCQWSYAVSGVNETDSFGLFDAGVGVAIQYTNRDTVYDLYGPTSYIGASFGDVLYVDVDAIMPNDTNKGVDGFQVVAGVGVGIDIHAVTTETKPVHTATQTGSGGSGKVTNTPVHLSLIYAIYREFPLCAVPRLRDMYSANGHIPPC